jgi:guanylate kinase
VLHLASPATMRQESVQVRWQGLIVGRLVILSGPSCVGKSPLYAALKKFYPHLAAWLTKLVLYDSRAPRPGEVDGVDFYFRTREYIEGLRGRENFTVFEVRGDLQALDAGEVERELPASDVFFDGNPFIGSGLLDLVEKHGAQSLSIFLSPLSREEVLEFKTAGRSISLPDLLTDMMRRKLLRRTTRQKGILSRRDLENIEVRAASACGELRQAWRFDYVIPNHDGEDSDNWDALYYPVGDARKALLAFAGLLEGKKPAHVEKWEQDLVP